MSKSTPHSTSRNTPNAAPARAEGGGEEDRSFAEVRRILQAVLRILWLHPWAFFVPFCIASSVAFVMSLNSPRTYTAYTTFERQTDPVGLDLSMSTGAAAFNHYRNTMVQDIRSVGVVGEALVAMGATDSFERDEDGALTEASVRRKDGMARSLVGTLTVNTRAAGKLMETVRISYTGPDPRIGKKLVDAVKEAYIRRTQLWIRAFLIDQRDYYAAQLGGAEEELMAARRVATMLRLEHPFIDPTDPGAISVQLSQHQDRRRNLELRRKEYLADLAAQEEMLAAISALPIASRANAPSSITVERPLSVEALRLQRDVDATTDEITELRATRGMTLHHPRILELLDVRRRADAKLTRQNDLDRQTAVANQMPEGKSGPAATPVLIPSPWNAERARVETRLAALQSKIHEVDLDVIENDDLIERLREAKRDIFSKQEEFSSVDDRVAKARSNHRRLEGMLASINPAIEATDNGRLVHFDSGSRARGSSLPISPKAKNIMFVSILIGLAFGAGFLILAEVLDHVYRSSSQVARSLGLPILEAIDEIITANDRRRHLVRRLVVVPLVLGLGLTATGMTGAMAYLSLTRPSTYQKLRRIPETAIEFFAADPATSKPTEPVAIKPTKLPRKVS